MTTSPSTMENLAIDTLINVLNGASGKLIDLDPDGKQKLVELEGKVFCLEITVPSLRLYLLPTAQGIEFQHNVESGPDVTLTGSAMAFARLGGAGAANGVLTQGQITVHGDAELGQAFQKILSGLDLDWEEFLSRYIGDTPARKVGNALRGLVAWAEHSVDLSRQNTADYLTEEKRILVTELAMERFDKAVNQTRADVDRLTQRVEKLKHTLDQFQKQAIEPTERLN